MASHSAHHLAPRRQHSQTHSEPDNSAVDASSLQNSVTGNAITLFLFFSFFVSFTLHPACSSRQRELSVKTLCSSVSAEFWRHFVVWWNSTPCFASTQERRNEYNEYFILSSGNRAHKLSCLQSHTCASGPRMSSMF